MLCFRRPSQPKRLPSSVARLRLGIALAASQARVRGGLLVHLLALAEELFLLVTSSSSSAFASSAFARRLRKFVQRSQSG